MTRNRQTGPEKKRTNYKANRILQVLRSGDGKSSGNSNYIDIYIYLFIYTKFIKI